MTIQLNVGDTFIPDVLVVDTAGVRLTGGTTFVVDIRRVSDNQYWDFGGTPQFRASGWTTRRATLTEVSSSNAPGCYQYATGWSTSGLSTSTMYIIEYSDTGTTAGNLPARDDAQLLNKTGFSLANGSIALATFAAGAIDATVLAANAIGASQLASNAITAAKVATDAIGAAQLATDAVTEIVAAVWAKLPGSPTAGSYGFYLNLIRKWTTWTATTLNKKYIDGTGANLIVTDDDGSTTLATVPITNYTAGNVTPSATEPTSLG